MFRLIKSIFRLQGEGNGGIMLFVISGKQVEILYEPVAVRCKKITASARSPQVGDKPLGFFPEKARRFSTESKYPCDKAFYYDRERRF